MSARNTANAKADTTNQNADATEVTAPVKAKAEIVVEALKIPVKLPMKQESISVMAICSDKDTADSLVEFLNSIDVEFSGKYERPNR